jgi:hypothetical protein
MPETDPLPGHLRTVIRDLVAAGQREATSHELLAALSPTERAGRTEVTTQELLAALPSAELLNHTEQQVGRALSLLGIRCRRAKFSGARFRVDELTTLNQRKELETEGLGRDPEAGPDAKTSTIGSASQHVDRVLDSPIENPQRDPVDPTGPDD